MILVDTSTWIDFFRKKVTPETDCLTFLIENNDDPCICGIVLTEMLQGLTSDKDYRAVKKALEDFVVLSMPRPAYYLAAKIYRSARAKGETIRNTVDCLIAACAIYHRVPILQNDKDFETIAKVSRLKLMEPLQS